MKEVITIRRRGADDAARQRNKRGIFKNCAPFIYCISKINNPQADNAKDLDVEMSTYNLIEYNYNSKTYGSLWQYYRDEPDASITNPESFKSKVSITGSTPAAGNTKYVKIAVPLKCLSNSWTTREIPLINCKLNLIITYSADSVISFADGATKFTILSICKSLCSDWNFIN